MQLRRIIFLLSVLLHIGIILVMIRIEIPMLSPPIQEKIIQIIPIAFPPIDYSAIHIQKKILKNEPVENRIDSIQASKGKKINRNRTGALVPEVDFQDKLSFEYPELIIPDLEQKSVKDLSVYSENIQNYLKGFDRKGVTNTTGLNSGGTEDVENTSTGSSGGKGRVIFNVRNFDLKPWAKQVLLRIKRNWMIPLTIDEAIKCPVELNLVIEKSGEISSITVKVSSHSDIFDQAAVNALRLSSPLPGLPLDFPAQNLEAVFLFASSDIKLN